MSRRANLSRRCLLVLGSCGLGLSTGWAAAQTQTLYVVVSAKSPWRTLTAKEVLALYTGRVRTLGDGVLATPLDQHRDGASREAFYRALTGLDIARINSYWARLHFTGQVQPPAAVGGDAEVAQRLLANPTAVGYMSQEPQDPNLRVALRLPVQRAD